MDEAAALLQDLQEAVMSEVHHLRETMVRLRPPVLDELGLVAALGDRIRQLQDRAGVAVEVHTDLAYRLPSELETVLYRVVQEALSNVAKHANASSVHPRLVDAGEAVLLEIVDDGAGFYPIREKGGAEHFGLMAMRERVEMAGGRWELESAPGMGTTIRARFEPQAAEGS